MTRFLDRPISAVPLHEVSVVTGIDSTIILGLLSRELIFGERIAGKIYVSPIAAEILPDLVSKYSRPLADHRPRRGATNPNREEKSMDGYKPFQKIERRGR